MATAAVTCRTVIPSVGRMGDMAAIAIQAGSLTADFHPANNLTHNKARWVSACNAATSASLLDAKIAIR